MRIVLRKEKDEYVL
jgi:hypothetical protein